MSYFVFMSTAVSTGNVVLPISSRGCENLNDSEIAKIHRVMGQ